MRILGIDPGSRLTGYALLEVQGGHVRFIEAGILRSKPVRARSSALRGPGVPARDLGGFPGRLAVIAVSLEEMLERCLPEETAVEDLFHAVHALLPGLPSV